MSALLEIHNITKDFPGVRANDDISLTVNKGEVVALLGENGAGKSTLVKAVFGLVRPTSGSISIKGQVLQAGDTAGAVAQGVEIGRAHV